MRPIVHDEWRQFDAQTHAYAEYRVFSALTAAEIGAASVRIMLDCVGRSGSLVERDVVCAIALITSQGSLVEALSIESHACAAIDGATEGIIRSHHQQESATRRSLGVSL